MTDSEIKEEASIIKDKNGKPKTEMKFNRNTNK
jgi:hypothetical protein